MLNLSQDFKEQAFAHIVYLASLGPRMTGTDGEVEAIEYVYKQFEELGIDVEVEPFEFESYTITDIELQIGNEMYRPTLLGFNPYLEVTSYQGEITLLDPQISDEDFNNSVLQDTVIVTTTPMDYFRLLFQKPLLIIFLDPIDYSALLEQNQTNFILKIHGEFIKCKSANVIGRLDPHSVTDQEIIISSHLDAYGDSPGADDNGSGVGVLIELARFFKTLRSEVKCSLIFAAFGAEEVSLLGSRVYVERHRNDLKSCVLVFNMDTVGGSSKPIIEMQGGVEGIPKEKGKSQIPSMFRNRALDGQLNNWKINNPELIPPMMVSNHPGWLLEIIDESIKELGLEFTPTGNLGSDQQAFAQAGIVSTGIGVMGNEVHGLEDTPDKINMESLEKTGKIVATVVMKTMDQLL